MGGSITKRSSRWIEKDRITGIKNKTKKKK
jgi:hypothetical protein